jgi:hypothetical protein
MDPFRETSMMNQSHIIDAQKSRTAEKRYCSRKPFPAQSSSMFHISVMDRTMTTLQLKRLIMEQKAGRDSSSPATLQYLFQNRKCGMLDKGW